MSVSKVKVVTVAVPNRGLHSYAANSMYRNWCVKHLGDMKVDWDYYPSANSFVFVRAEDATAFRLRFGL